MARSTERRQPERRQTERRPPGPRREEEPAGAQASPGSGLSKKIGPFPLWLWLAGGALLFYYYYSSKSSSAATTSTTATGATGPSGPWSGGGGWGYGGGGGGATGATGATGPAGPAATNGNTPGGPSGPTIIYVNNSPPPGNIKTPGGGSPSPGSTGSNFISAISPNQLVQAGLLSASSLAAVQNSQAKAQAQLAAAKTPKQVAAAMPSIAATNPVASVNTMTSQYGNAKTAATASQQITGQSAAQALALAQQMVAAAQPAVPKPVQTQAQLASSIAAKTKPSTATPSYKPAAVKTTTGQTELVNVAGRTSIRPT